jgi:hypothetical protein
LSLLELPAAATNTIPCAPAAMIAWRIVSSGLLLSEELPPAPQEFDMTFTPIFVA